MGADFRFKRSKTSFLCKANKLRENYDAEVYVVIKRDQRYAIYASSSSSKWPPSLDSIKNSNRLNEVWYPENIHLLEPKKKSSPERGGEMQILELPPVWNSDNGPSATNTVWATDKETSPDLLDINYHSAVSEGGSHISGNQSKIQQSPNVYISNNPPEFCGHQSFYPSYNDEWDVTQEISNFQDQIPRPDSFNTLKSRLNIQKTVPSSQKPSVPSVSLQQRAQESENPHEIEAGNIILSSLGMEPPRFKTEMLQKNKRERTIFS
ncbi:hypothetical protein TWF706_000040 [Orbilia oligospora]|nr:hypothetical protein TWF706_000040 [Orbilia oligospora]KAF3151674.1 hypothetical protein TWF751_005048 [Orbilia oligospora]